MVLAVLKAYSVKKICMFDVEKTRTEFAVKYGADVGIVPPKREEDKDPLEFAQEYAKQIIAEQDVGTGFDITSKLIHSAQWWSHVASLICNNS